MRLALLLQVCDMALHYLDVCLPAQGPLAYNGPAPPAPVPAATSSSTDAQPPQPQPSSVPATASAPGRPPASTSSCLTSCAVEPLAALGDPEAQAAFMQDRLLLATNAMEIAARALSRWVPQRGPMMTAS